MREGIRSGKEMAGDMDDFEVKISEVEQPSHLVTVKVLCLMKVCQVLVIGKDLDGEQGVMEVVPPRPQGADDCKELPVVNVVVLFGWDE